MKRLLTSIFSLLMVVGMAMAQDEPLTPTVDGYVRSNSATTAFTTQNQIETSTSSGTYFYGLMQFDLPEKEGYKVSKATLRLVTKRAKAGSLKLNVYAYDADVPSNATYNNQLDNITAALTADPLQTISVKYEAQGDITSDNLTFNGIENWTNTIDLTAYAQKIGTGRMSLLFENENSAQLQVFSVDNSADITNSKNSEIVLKASDIIPQLTLEYTETAERTVTVGNYKLSTDKYYVFTSGKKNSDNTFSEELVDDKALAMTATASNIKYNYLSNSAEQVWQLEYAGEQTISTAADKTETVQAFYLKSVGLNQYLNITVKDASAGTYNGYPAFSDSKDENSMIYFAVDGSSKDMIHLRTVVQMKGASNYTARNVGHNTHKDGQNIAADANSGSANMWIPTEVAPITISSLGYASFSSTSAVDFTDREDIEAYAAYDNDGTVELAKVDVLPANEGAIIAGDAGTYYAPVASEATALTETNLLKAVSETTTIYTTADGNTNYVLSKKDGEAAFLKAKAAGTEIEAGKAYLQIAGESAGDKVSIIFRGGNATGIDQAKAETRVVENGVFYTLQGVRVATPQKGQIYIVNGKKVVVK